MNENQLKDLFQKVMKPKNNIDEIKNWEEKKLKEKI